MWIKPGLPLVKVALDYIAIGLIAWDKYCKTNFAVILWQDFDS